MYSLYEATQLLSYNTRYFSTVHTQPFQPWLVQTDLLLSIFSPYITANKIQYKCGDYHLAIVSNRIHFNVVVVAISRSIQIILQEMGRAPCCEKVGLKRGRWKTEEDEILTSYILANGEGSWRSLPKNAGNSFITLNNMKVLHIQYSFYPA